jgi:hypothetical protein
MRQWQFSISRFNKVLFVQSLSWMFTMATNLFFEHTVIDSYLSRILLKMQRKISH